MNILIFSPVKIYPADAGSRIRILNVVNYLINQGHNIHYVYYTDDGISKVHFEYMMDICDSFSVIEKKTNMIRRTGNYKLDEWYEDNIHIRIVELIKIFNIDTVLINYMFYSKLFEYLPNDIYKIIDTHDKFTDRYKLFSNVSDVEYDWHSYSKEDESTFLNRADMVLAITNEEKNYFSTICREDISIATLGHIENERFLKKEYNTLENIGFIGGANKVNIVAINEFLDVFYRVPSNKENLKIVIAGQICNHIKKKNKNIILLGHVEDLEEFYGIVDVIINPLMFGTGQKIKSVEALSFGLPIISTKIGFEGINSNNKFHRLDSIEDMINAIDVLKADTKEIKQLSFDSCQIFNNYCNEISNSLKYIFSNNKNSTSDCEVLLKHKTRIQKETYNVLIGTYLRKAKQRNIELKEQASQIEKQASQIEKQASQIEKQASQIEKQNIKITKYKNIIDSIKEITRVSLFKNPFKKYKLYKEIIKTYYLNIK